MDLDDMGMMQPRYRLGLDLEPGQKLRVVLDSGADHLQGDEAVQGPLSSLVDDTHASAAKFPENVVVGDHWPGRSGSPVRWQLCLHVRWQLCLHAGGPEILVDDTHASAAKFPENVVVGDHWPGRSGSPVRWQLCLHARGPEILQRSGPFPWHLLWRR